MAEADDTPTRWASLAKVFARYAKIYGEAVAKHDLPARLGSGKVSWRGEKRGQGPLDVGDPRVFRRGDSTDALLGISLAEGRVIRGTAPQRIIVRPGERAYRPAPRRYEFVRIEIALDELIALMPEDVRAKMEGGLSRVGDLFSRRKPKPTQKQRPGPKKGVVTQLTKSDREHFPTLRKLMATGMAITTAARSLGEKLAGGGNPDSKARRLVRRFKKDGGGI